MSLGLLIGYKRLLGNIGVRHSCPVVKPFLSSLHCLKVRLCVEQERRSMKARQAMLESKLPSERERRRGGSKEWTWKIVNIVRKNSRDLT